MTTTAQSIESVATELGLSMTAKFVPWSQSRNAGDKHHSLNWVVTLHKDGRDVLTTDYMAGSAHAPSYKPGKLCVDDDAAIKNECENGRDKRRQPILPKLADVLYSLASDADALNYGAFEEWASGMGCDADSRKSEVIYRACLNIGLRLRAALGDDGLAQLVEAVRDY